MSEHNEALGVEQRCVHPGRWLIEGYDTIKRPTGEWAIFHFDKWMGDVDTLAEAREWIKGQVV